MPICRATRERERERKIGTWHRAYLLPAPLCLIGPKDALWLWQLQLHCCYYLSDRIVARMCVQLHGACGICVAHMQIKLPFSERERHAKSIEMCPECVLRMPLPLSIKLCMPTPRTPAPPPPALIVAHQASLRAPPRSSTLPASVPLIM